ncbi:MAG: hypothetical protein FJW14_07830 [Acidimicrobiia bacterium]|nr:hypothetical protein [Acidimicrobiia bacterium]
MLTTPEVLHFVGYLTGATLYAMLLGMAVRTGRRHGDRLTIATGALGLAWNVGELTAHAFTSLGLSMAADWMAAASYGALGYLAAVAVHSAGATPPGDGSATPRSWTRAVLTTMYVCAGVAAVLHAMAAAVGQELPSRPGLVLLTAGLATVVVPLLFITRRQPHSRRALWMSALALFAVSALHLSSFHGASETWGIELVGHHASIPLAFAILHQDYRFALADLFLKRALSLLALVTIVFGAWTTIASTFLDDGVLLPQGVAALLALWTGSALLFPWIHRSIAGFVDRVILSRTGYDTVVGELTSVVQRAESADALLSRACEALARALGATGVTWHVVPDVSEVPPQCVAIPTAEAPYCVLAIGSLAVGRRMLSDDIAMLERVAFLLARRIDALRITEERYERMLREHEITTLATEAELRALRAQINPHFLFNALTTIGYLIQQAPARAFDTLMRLTTLLRGVLRSDGEFTTVASERELIECYLRIEAERFEERLTVSVDVPDDLAHVPIPSLIVQPLVENAIKHGIAPAREGGTVAVAATLDRDGAALRLTVRNTGIPWGCGQPATGGGIGLKNIEQRLRCYYGDAAALTLGTDAGGATIAEIRLPLVDLEAERVPALAEARRR